jgi:hypothetical protein
MMWICWEISAVPSLWSWETLIDAGGKNVNVVESKYMLLSRHQNEGENRDIVIAAGDLKIYHSSSIWGRQ